MSVPAHNALPASTVTAKKAAISPVTLTVLNTVTSSAQTHAAIKSSLGNVSDEYVEHHLSMLVDEALAVRDPGTKGDRTTAKYLLP